MKIFSQSPAIHDFDHQSRLRAMFESAAIGIGICHLNGRIADANPELSRLLGYSNDELANSDILQLLDAPRLEVDHEIHQADPGTTHEITAGYLSRNGGLLAGLLRGERNSFAMEKCYLRKSGSELWCHLTVSLARDLCRKPAFLIAMLADATAQKLAEAHLREAEKMEVMGRLAAGIAHDFNNLLTGILLYCDLLSAELLSDGGTGNSESAAGVEIGASKIRNFGASDLSQHVEEVRLAGEQGAALTHQLLAIARKQGEEPRPVAINEIVTSTNNLLRRLIGKQIELITVLDPEAGRVRADPAQLRQVLLNLVLNARDAMPQGGTITLSTRVAEFPSKFASELSRTTGAESPRRAVLLVVRDNGHGMNAETRMRLFEPFFTTKNPGDGTGLGLATVQRVVGELGATISIESEVGRGTCIGILIPSLMASIEKISNYGNFSNPRFSDPKVSIEQSSNQDDTALSQPHTPELLAKPAGNLVCDN
jgi:signal transduction histidine kinase